MIQNVILDKDVTDWDVDCTPMTTTETIEHQQWKRLKEETQSLFKNFEFILELTYLILIPTL